VRWPNSSTPEFLHTLIDSHVRLSGVSHVHLVNCTFRHLGGAALHFGAGTQHSSVSHSLFHDDSAAAVTVGEIADWSEPQPSRQTFNNTVADSTITDLPKEFRGAVSLSVFVAAATQLLHNAINGSSYSAITVGWGWHTQLGNTSYARDNRVVGNAISNSLQLLFDGGDIYTLGSQPGSVLAYNHIRGHGDCPKTAALYHDDGSAHFTDYGNVIQLNASCPTTKVPPWVSMWTHFIHGIRLDGNYADSVNAVNAGTNCSITGTTLIVGDELPPAAQAIVLQTGPRSYTHSQLSPIDLQIGTRRPLRPPSGYVSAYHH